MRISLSEIRGVCPNACVKMVEEQEGEEEEGRELLVVVPGEMEINVKGQLVCCLLSSALANTVHLGGPSPQTNVSKVCV